MANIILRSEDDFYTLTPTASTEASGFPDDNLANYAEPGKEWRSTVTTATTIVLDTATGAAPLKAVALFNCNWTTGDIEAHNTDAWGAPDYTSAITLTEDNRVGRYKLFHAMSETLRYVRICIDNQTPTDGEAFFRIGAVVILSDATAMTINPQYPFPYTPAKGQQRIDYDSGPKDYIGLGVHRGITFDMSFRGSTSLESAVQDINDNDPGTIFLLYENTGTTSQVYLGHLDQAFEFSRLAPRIFSTNTVEFNEVT